jgi:catechol 2,3-dioxygenase
MSVTPVIGPVTLRVRALAASRRFYREVLGLHATDASPCMVHASGGPDLLRLVERPDVEPGTDSPGLYHFALLLPSREELARVLKHLRDRAWPLHGVADHAVSEAVYLADPDGNGIELYRDRPPAEWPRRDGTLAMTTERLDVASLLRLAEGAPVRFTAPPETVVGHIHLHVSDLTAAERFYAGVLGMDVTVRDYPGALFLSYRGYHHHVGANTWAPRNHAARDRRPGLEEFAVATPPERRRAILDRAAAAGLAVVEEAGDALLRDQDGLAVRLTAQASEAA